MSTLKLAASIAIAFVLLAFCFPSFASEKAAAEQRFTIPGSSVFELKDPNTERTYPIFVKLPRTYLRADANSRDKQYPVIYMTDAMYAFQVISGATRLPMNMGRMEEVILVGISYATSEGGVASRVRNYTPTRDKSWKLETGKADEHIDFMANILIPHIENNYRAMQNNRTFVGNSLGGLLGGYMLLSQPDVFDNYVIGSPSVWFNDDFLLTLPTDKLDLTKKRVFIGVGELETKEFKEQQEMVLGATALYEKLQPHIPSANLTLKVVSGADHATAFPTVATQGLYWLHKKDQD